MNAYRVLFPAVILALLVCTEAFAAGGLMVDPLRVVFDGNQRTAQFNLMNTGERRLTYRLSFVQRQMSENGQLVDLGGSGTDPHSVASLIRFAPRQVTLEPGGEQIVKLVLRKPADLQPGEYRSHLLLQPVPDSSAPDANGSPDAEPSPQQELGIGLDVVLGISMPVVVRHGGASATTTISDIAPPAGPGSGTLRFALRRSGDASTYGDCTVFLREEGEPERKVGKAAGLAVYPPLELRWVAVPIDPLPAKGQLRIEYRSSTSDGGKLLAEAIVQLQ